MIKQSRRSRMRIRPRFFIMLLALAVLPLAIFVLPRLSRPKAALIQWGALGDKASAPCVVVREERVVTSKDFGRVERLVSEGEVVNKDAKVVRIYKSGYSQDVLAEYQSVRQKILDYQQNNIMKDIVDNDLQQLNAQIALKAEEIAQASRSNQEVHLLKMERELEALLESRVSYLRRTVSADNYLTRLYEEESALSARIDGWVSDGVAPLSGIVSFYVDGREALLKPEAIGDITYTDVQNILSGAAMQNASAGNTSVAPVVFRVVNNYKWYVLILSAKDQLGLVLRQSYDVTFKEIPGTTFRGTVVARKPSGSNMLEVMEMTCDIGPLASVRTLNGSIGMHFEGLKVPARALVQDKSGQIGVQLILESGSREFIPVDVLVKSGNEAIVAARDGANKLEVNQRIALR